MRRRLGAIIAVSFCFVGFATAELQDVKVETPSLKLGGILQSTVSYTMDTTAKAQLSFNMTRARFFLWGVIVPDKVKYVVQADACLEVFLLDSKFQFFYLPKTEIAVGRFLPNFTYYMPQPVAKLDVINYPLVTSKYAMWRQVGVQTTTRTPKVDFDLGIFNGYPTNNWCDNNEGKDLLVRATVKPIDFLQVIGYGWFGNMLLAEENDLTKNRFGGGVIVNKKLSEAMSVSVRGELVMGADEGVADTTINSIGYYAHIGFKPNPQFEILGRYDSFDPNSDVTDNEETWITGGVNYSISEDRAKIYLNYTMKSETPSVDNDVIGVQFQVFF